MALLSDHSPVERLLRGRECSATECSVSRLVARPRGEEFEQHDGSSEGDVILLKACKERLRLSERQTRYRIVGRQADRVAHSIEDLARQ